MYFIQTSELLNTHAHTQYIYIYIYIYRQTYTVRHGLNLVQYMREAPSVIFRSIKFVDNTSKSQALPFMTIQMQLSICYNPKHYERSRDWIVLCVHVALITQTPSSIESGFTHKIVSNTSIPFWSFLLVTCREHISVTRSSAQLKQNLYNLCKGIRVGNKYIENDSGTAFARKWSSKNVYHVVTLQH